MNIHKEGRKILLALTSFLLIANLAVYHYVGDPIASQSTIVISAILFLLVLQFFRNPQVISVQNENHILAPADGKVVVIEEVVEEEYFKSKKTQVSIFMSPINVHVNRNPVSGIVSYLRYHPGKYLVAWHPKSSTQNERTTVVVKMKNDLEVMFRQIAGAVARRIKFYVNEGDTVEQGHEFGFIKFGSRVDVLLPGNFEIKVKIGDSTTGGKTILAEIID